MRFASPIFLVLAAAVPFAGFFWSFLKARREKALARLTRDVPRTPFAGVRGQSFCWTRFHGWVNTIPLSPAS